MVSTASVVLGRVGVAVRVGVEISVGTTVGVRVREMVTDGVSVANGDVGEAEAVTEGIGVGVWVGGAVVTPGRTPLTTTAMAMTIVATVVTTVTRMETITAKSFPDILSHLLEFGPEVVLPWVGLNQVAS
jgi:hypothetical protein